MKKLFKEPLTFAFDEESNFTWEHFFSTHCGILPEDALKYEKSLIAHRMSPLDTLHESIALIVEYGKIPVGDKLKIVKTINKATDAMKRGKNQMDGARKKLGLQEFNDFEAGVILDLANGDTENYIDYAIEQFEDGKKEMERWISLSMLKDPQARENYT